MARQRPLLSRLRMDSFLQCIPPGRLGYLFCKIRSFKLKPTSISSVGRQESSLSIHSSFWGIPALVECLVGESVSSATLYAPGSGQSCWMGGSVERCRSVSSGPEHVFHS
uniref:Orf109b n=1 Tax=Batis maritima TaxID=4436 RepID=A0A068BE95_BATMA|nr:orf109b [Batis maritima]AIC83386.1 orf109b [Batis maritima]